MKAAGRPRYGRQESWRRGPHCLSRPKWAARGAWTETLLRGTGDLSSFELALLLHAVSLSGRSHGQADHGPDRQALQPGRDDFG